MTYSVMIIGRPWGKFAASRVLRQGDPPSPYLFTIAVDVLSSLVERAVKFYLIKSLEFGRASV